MNLSAYYFLVAVALFVIIQIYFRIADKFNIIDKPNLRSSHSSLTLRGGGIIFPISFLLWFLLNDFQYPFLMVGVILISTISFLDDIITLSAKPRLLVHLISVLLLMVDLGFLDFDWWFWILGIILIIGWLNTFNFMDGINGITVLYAFSVIAPLYYLNETSGLVPASFYIYVALGLAVFGFFNIRKKAKTFAGDVGSISLGLIITFLLIGEILKSGHWEYIVFIAVYGVDSVLTIFQRLIKRENIFEAHRSHLYQLLANEFKLPHVFVSILYALIQISMSALLLFNSSSESYSILALSILVGFILLYIGVKTTLLRKMIK